MIESRLRMIMYYTIKFLLHPYREDRAPEYSLFVGDLSNDIDETFLLVQYLDS